MNDQFLPISIKDMEERNWDQLDFLLITGDAYIDHPSFGTAIISRVLESMGYKVGIIPQPDWRSVTDFIKLGSPRLGILITAGNIDSMVNHYTVSKKRRKNDYYSPGGKMGLRPDRATIVYANRAREAFKNTPIIIGGIEASLRRFAHYDYWDNKVRRSILLDSKADLLFYGMSEKSIIELAEALEAGISIKDIQYIRGTCYTAASLENVPDYIILPSYEEVAEDKKKYAKAAKTQYDQQDAITGKAIVQYHGKELLIQNPPQYPMTQSELDDVYQLPYMRDIHPIYKKYGDVPAIREVKFSIISQRGCFGACNFCALGLHQGRTIQSRSEKSIIDEAKKITEQTDFKGYIHDVGGPTANFRKPSCEKQLEKGVCKDKQCLFPKPCNNLDVDHSEYLSILRKLRKLPRVKKVFIRSGIRYDYMMQDKSLAFFKELVQHHISGQLKVAPEHISSRVLEKMGKPKKEVYDAFTKKFYKLNKQFSLDQYLVPYLMSSHPGSDLKAAVELAEYVRDMGYNPEQIQDFYPTPGSLSTAMYYTGIDPRTMEKVYVAKSPKEKAMQRALIQYRNPKNYDMVFEALVKAGRKDLIGFGPKCLIKPRRIEKKPKKDNSITPKNKKIPRNKRKVKRK
jgi:uncharacterized radical SAM protein YgiQ